MHLHQRAAQFGIRIGIFAPGHGDAVALGQQFERLDKADALDLHDKVENVATQAAAEALEALHAGIDVE